MNEFSGYALKRGIGWWAMLRFARDAKPKPLMGDKGAPTVFDTELEALRAVNKHLLAYFNGHLVRDGERCGTAKARAESFFKPRPAASEREKVSA